MTDGEILLLGLGTTLGAVMQALVLWPSLRRCGVRLRLRSDLRGQGLGAAWSLARWAILLVLVNQIGTLVVIRLATGINATSNTDAGAAVYQMAFAIFMLPQSVITVSIVTALLPHLSKEAAAGHFDVMRERIGWTLRTSGSLMVPAAAAFMVLGIPIAVLLFRYGSVNLEAARLLGLTLSGMALGLPAFSAYYVLMRGFYALEDTRTPTYNAMILNGSNIVLAVVAVAWVPTRCRDPRSRSGLRALVLDRVGHPRAEAAAPARWAGRVPRRPHLRPGHARLRAGRGRDGHRGPGSRGDGRAGRRPHQQRGDRAPAGWSAGPPATSSASGSSGSRRSATCCDW